MSPGSVASLPLPQLGAQGPQCQDAHHPSSSSNNHLAVPVHSWGVSPDYPPAWMTVKQIPDRSFLLQVFQYGSFKSIDWDLPAGPVVKNLPSNARDMGSIPGRGTKIPHATEQLSPRATTREKAECHNYRALAPQLERNPRATRKDPACRNKDPTYRN